MYIDDFILIKKIKNYHNFVHHSFVRDRSGALLIFHTNSKGGSKIRAYEGRDNSLGAEQYFVPGQGRAS